MMETPIPDSYHPSRKPSSFRLSRQQSSLTFHTELIKKEEGPNQKNYSCDSCEIL
ncbi:hypothetical protein [Piscirickettsia salmonis]|uniref:hypothetical protein n=1 Tax=Piscirickettsia salmonis TaxID=1238 RepID=UPI003A7FF343